MNTIAPATVPHTGDRQWDRLQRMSARLLGSIGGAAHSSGADDDRWYVPREIETALLDRIVDPAAEPQIVVGDAGHGKSTLLWSLHRALELRGEQPLLVSATWLQRGGDGTALLSSADITDAVVGRPRSILLLDTADLLLHSPAARAHVLDLVDTLSRARIPVVLTTRALEWRHLPPDLGHTIRLGPYSRDTELPSAIEAMVAEFCTDSAAVPTAPVAAIISARARGTLVDDVCTSPLLLRLLFSLSAPQFPHLELDVTGLYNLFWARRIVDRREVRRLTVDVRRTESFRELEKTVAAVVPPNRRLQRETPTPRRPHRAPRDVHRGTTSAQRCAEPTPTLSSRDSRILLSNKSVQMFTNMRTLAQVRFGRRVRIAPPGLPDRHGEPGHDRKVPPMTTAHHVPTDPVEVALRLVKSIALSVPAYRRLLADHGVDPDTIAEMTDLTQLPITTKESYRRTNMLAELHTGMPGAVETIAASAGSSGTPTFWSRGQSSTDHGASMFGCVLRESADTENLPTLALVTFPLGPYVGGVFMYAMLLELRRRGHKISIATPGMDTAAIADVLDAAADGYRQIVIFAYPPLARDLLDTHGELLRRHHAIIVVGGEPVSEAWRTLVHTLLDDTGGDRVRVVYGATDVGFVGYETAATIAIRSAAAHDRTLDDAIFGLRHAAGDLVQQPAFVQYRPEATYIEVDPDGYLLFTVGGVLPLVRYRVNDRGDTLTGSDVQDRVRGAGYPDLAEAIDPAAAYLLVHGRTDVAAIFSAVNLYPDYFRPAVEHLSLATRLTGRFTVTGAVDTEQHQTLTDDAELRPGQHSDSETVDHLTYLNIASLRQLSAEYRVVHDQKGHSAEPVVRLLPFGSDGFVTDGKQHTIR